MTFLRRISSNVNAQGNPRALALIFEKGSMLCWASGELVHPSLDDFSNPKEEDDTTQCGRLR